MRAAGVGVDQQMLRLTAASGPQHLLLTLLGDYWYPRFDAVASAALVDLLAEFEVSEANTRAVLSRMSRKELLVAGRQGRRTTYALSPSAMRTLHEGTRRIFTFGDYSPGWDGRWTLVAFSIPEENRSIRSTLRIRLGWEGFASLFDGVWVAPGARAEAAARLVNKLGVDMATILVGRSSDLVPGGSPTRAWDLRGLQGRYEAFIRSFAPVAERIAGEEPGEREALIIRTAVIDAWRGFPAVDPELPGELLPDGWPQSRARELFTSIYDSLGPSASTRFREVLARRDPDSAALVAHHSSTDALQLCTEADTK